MEHFIIFKDLINSNFIKKSKFILYEIPYGKIYEYKDYKLFLYEGRNPFLSKMHTWTLDMDIDYNFLTYHDYNNKDKVTYFKNLPFISNLKTISEDELMYLSLMDLNFS